MEGLSEIIENIQIPVRIPIHSYLLDHCVEGRAVLPAVEAMEVLAASVRSVRPGAFVENMADGRFDKFLPISPGQSHIDAVSDIAFHENGNITARLLTKTISKKASITRVKTHAQICFCRTPSDTPKIPFDLASSLEGVVFHIPVDKT
jgi:hypothetical protein